MGSALGVGFPPPNAPQNQGQQNQQTPETEQQSSNLTGSDILDAKRSDFSTKLTDSDLSPESSWDNNHFWEKFKICIGEKTETKLFPKLLWLPVRQNCSSNQEKLLRFEADDREFLKFLKLLEQFIQTEKGK